jgi:tripartite-type tricarboxylate transporter receptor subunit TctC
MTIRPIRRAAWLVCMALTCLPGATTAQSGYPNRPIKIVVPWPAGGSTDSVARLVAQKLSPILQQPVVVENRPGATGTTGTLSVIQAPADGYTLLFLAASLHSFSPHLLKEMRFDTVADITPITVSVLLSYVLTVSADSPYRTVSDLVQAAKAQPGKLAYGSFGIGSGPHIITELFKQQTGIDALHVPYKGGSQVTAAVMGGEVPFMFDSLPSPLGQIRGGRLRALAVTSPTRSAAAPDVPTLKEAGVPIEAVGWLGLGGPPKLPPEVTARLFDAMKQVAGDADMTRRLVEMGAEPAVSTSPESFRQYMLAERERWGRVIRGARITVD